MTVSWYTCIYIPIYYNIIQLHGHNFIMYDNNYTDENVK